MPLSFHSLPAVSNLKSFARLEFTGNHINSDVELTMGGMPGACLHFEKDIFVLFMSLYFYLLCEFDDWLEMSIGLFFLL